MARKLRRIAAAAIAVPINRGPVAILRKADGKVNVYRSNAQGLGNLYTATTYVDPMEKEILRNTRREVSAGSGSGNDLSRANAKKILDDVEEAVSVGRREAGASSTASLADVTEAAGLLPVPTKLLSIIRRDAEALPATALDELSGTLDELSSPTTPTTTALDLDKSSDFTGTASQTSDILGVVRREASTSSTSSSEDALLTEIESLVPGDSATNVLKRDPDCGDDHDDSTAVTAATTVGTASASASP
ncbi:hypothetical protein LTR78_007794 [Recurvomyces mirabilis]|uniref:Uncharacterized protein n=1 Tax=Recurvomyces mirabilis TaxID=574656 RepID=A0AAE0WFY1_9PEZI|nr:hypothetical protein LTR78_007794 [Recurvomyces mirabilis]KAK5160164.1 hypothetical protein LTS14_002271 [Recurvomyces mirabilis]